jgi:hypothetical protein
VFPDISHRSVLFETHVVSETGFFLRLQVESPQLNPINRAEIRICSIDWVQLCRFHLKTETEFSPQNVVCFK